MNPERNQQQETSNAVELAKKLAGRLATLTTPLTKKVERDLYAQSLIYHTDTDFIIELGWSARTRKPNHSWFRLNAGSLSNKPDWVKRGTNGEWLQVDLKYQP